LKTILFDLDGTLIDSTEAILESFDYSFKELGLDLYDAKKIKSLIGYPLDIMYEKLGVEDRLIDEIIKAYKSNYRLISREKTTLLPNAKEALELAANEARLGIVTTKTARYSKELLEHMGVMEYFEVLIGREDVEFPKPHAQPVLKALEFMGAQKDGACLIGDTVLDLKSAKNADIKPVAVTCGYGEKEELEKYTKSVYNDAYEAVKNIV